MPINLDFRSYQISSKDSSAAITCLCQRMLNYSVHSLSFFLTLIELIEMILADKRFEMIGNVK